MADQPYLGNGWEPKRVGADSQESAPDGERIDTMYRRLFGTSGGDFTPASEVKDHGIEGNGLGLLAL
jgi:hypothetical protein